MRPELNLESYRWIRLGVGPISPTTLPASVVKAAAKAEKARLLETGHNPLGFTIACDDSTVIAVG